MQSEHSATRLKSAKHGVALRTQDGPEVSEESFWLRTDYRSLSLTVYFKGNSRKVWLTVVQRTFVKLLQCFIIQVPKIEPTPTERLFCLETAHAYQVYYIYHAHTCHKDRVTVFASSRYLLYLQICNQVGNISSWLSFDRSSLMHILSGRVLCYTLCYAKKSSANNFRSP